MVYLQAFRKYFRQAKNLIFLRNAGWHKSMANGDIEKKTTITRYLGSKVIRNTFLDSAES